MIARMRPQARARSIAVLGLVLGASLEACNLAPAAVDHVEMNTCKVPMDCTGDAECRSGRCMARSTPAPLNIVLEVTPRRPSNATDALPFRFSPLVLNESETRQLEIPATLNIDALLRESNTVLPASVTFTPTAAVPGISVKTVTASTSSAGLAKNADYTIQLFDGVEYRMLVRPSDPLEPPFRRTFTASSATNLDIDYASVDKPQKTFAITGAPAGTDVILNAYDRTTGEPVSSTGTLANGKVTLKFVPDVVKYRLEIRLSAASGATAAKTADPSCDISAPAYPLFSVLDDQLAEKPSDGIVYLRLPTPPPRIRYEGTVALCAENDMEPSLVGNLPLAMRSTKVFVDDASGIVVSYNATTNARYDSDTRQFRYCVQVEPGQYDVVVTPPSGVDCSLFAEPRLVQAPADATSATGMQLALPKPLYVSGVLQAMDSAPLKGATVDAVSLGRPDSPADVATTMRLTRFNRSQEAASDGQGSFKLPVDEGSYDILIKPPAISGFPWQVRYDVRVDDTTQGDEWSTRISMVSPVSLEGTLHAQNVMDAVRLAGAGIDAYALVTDSAGTERAINIGKTVSDAASRFELLLPPSTQMHWGADDQASK